MPDNRAPPNRYILSDLKTYVSHDGPERERDHAMPTYGGAQYHLIFDADEILWENNLRSFNVICFGRPRV